MVKIAIVDVVGLAYDGSTLATRGLGGSESAVILMSAELAKLGFDVTVYNNCIDSEAAPGVYNNVCYRDLTFLDTCEQQHYDVIISSRTVVPYIKEEQYNDFVRYRPERYKKLTGTFKAVWMHDTFCTGDHLLESLAVEGRYDEIFTLSDFHTSYVTTCDHSHKRMFEVLKNKVFQTRNGIVLYDTPAVDKDPNLFVYNASVTKGMLPLVNSIWPIIKSQLPDARLKVIGGYYRFKENEAPDEQEQTWRDIVNNPAYEHIGIEFTGIITQQEIANILSEASLMLYPSEFPETFGISTLESLAYNTPLVTNRFGALEETALNEACYLIDYPIRANGLYPNINFPSQVQKFITKTISAVNDTYLLQQKREYCNIIKDVCTWDTIALQWKQHLYKVLGLYLDADEYSYVSYINARVQQIFKRKFTSEVYIPRQKEHSVVVVTPVYNAEQYIEKCIRSVYTQDYTNWKMYIIDDASTDNTLKVIYDTIPSEFKNNITVIPNKDNYGAVYNQIKTIKAYCNSNDYIMLLDGDDSLVNDNQIFQMYNNLYHTGVDFTYGSAWSLADQIPLVAQSYPTDVIANKTFRQHLFSWNIPYTHLRTFNAGLIKKIPDVEFKDDSGNWFKAGGDCAVFYASIERASKIHAVRDIVYNYNDLNPINDYKVNAKEQTMTAKQVLNSNTKTILIAIPTNKYIEPQTFKSIYDLEVPDGYSIDFQYFYGYQIDQIRNLIASWAVKYDYLFSVDSDISFPADTLVKLLSHNTDIVSGLYIQRIPGQHNLELYRNGVNVEYNDVKGKRVVEVDSCGFGCVLIKSNVIQQIEYPQFVYKSAIDHNNTISEDTYFCLHAREKGFKVYADPSVLCEHHGSYTFKV